MKRKSSCDLAHTLRGNKKLLSKEGRAYMLIAVMTAKWVSRRRRKFSVSDVSLRRLPGISPQYVRSIINEHLGAWHDSADPGSSLFSGVLLHNCPQLHERVVKYWSGY